MIRNNADRGGMPRKVSLETLEKCYTTDGPVKVIAGPADLMFRAITKEQSEKFPDMGKRPSAN